MAGISSPPFPPQTHKNELLRPRYLFLRTMPDQWQTSRSGNSTAPPYIICSLLKGRLSGKLSRQGQWRELKRALRYIQFLYWTSVARGKAVLKSLVCLARSFGEKITRIACSLAGKWTSLIVVLQRNVPAYLYFINNLRTSWSISLLSYEQSWSISV